MQELLLISFIYTSHPASSKISRTLCYFDTLCLTEGQRKKFWIKKIQKQPKQPVPKWGAQESRLYFCSYLAQKTREIQTGIQKSWCFFWAGRNLLQKLNLLLPSLIFLSKRFVTFPRLLFWKTICSFCFCEIKGSCVSSARV